MIRRGARLFAAVLAFVLLSVAAGRASEPARVITPSAEPSFFGTVEIKRQNLAPFPKWSGLLQRYLAEKAASNEDCHRTPVNLCAWKDWQDFVRAQSGKPLRQQLDAVNGFMNRRPYIIDMINWGVEDYWATPSEFLRKDGDCEDFAIAKFFTLRALGHQEVDMRVVVVQDLNLKIAHALLVVRGEDGKVWVLDNQIRQVAEAGSIRHYRPIYSVNEQNWWLHRQP